MARATSARRRKAWQFGLAAEAQAAWLLRLKGYRILAQRFRTPLGEIDLVARRGRLIAFVEVKARGPDSLDGLEAVGPAKQHRIAKAADAYLAQESPSFDECAFLVAMVDLDELAIEWIDDAFDAPW